MPQAIDYYLLTGPTYTVRARRLMQSRRALRKGRGRQDPGPANLVAVLADAGRAASRTGTAARCTQAGRDLIDRAIVVRPRVAHAVGAGGSDEPLALGDRGSVVGVRLYRRSGWI